MKRFASVIGIKSEHYAEYERLHANVWPDVLTQIAASNIRNYSIYRFGDLLFSYFEYVGEDFDNDMAKMAEDATTQEWWNICKPLQTSLNDPTSVDWWTSIPEVFHVE